MFQSVVIIVLKQTKNSRYYNNIFLIFKTKKIKQHKKQDFN